jgi:hypothetical protein
MLRRLLVAATAVAFMAPANAQAQISVFVDGGVNAQVGRLGDDADIGYHVAGGVNMSTSILPMGLRFEAAYGAFGIKSGGGDVRIVSGTVNGIFNVGTTRDAPYILAGIGAYNRNVSTSGLGYGSGKTAFGINGGGGLRFPLSGITTFFEARYNIMLGNTAEGTNYQFIPITFGIMF